MRRRGVRLRVTMLAGMLAGAPVHAQTPAPEPPPGPYVIDLRGALSGFPASAPFYPLLPVGTMIAKRGFGFEVGAHVYPLQFRAVRVGIGASFIDVRGTASTPPSTGAEPTQPLPDVRTTARIVAPQVSINFGKRDGWSYLSAGFDAARMKATATSTESVTGESGTMSGFNLGGGARWFVSDHFAVGFDIRWHHLSGTALFSAGAGVSVR